MALRRKPSDGALFSSRDPGLGRATPHKRAAAGGDRGARRPRRCARLCCLGLVGYLVLAFLAGAVYVKPRLDSFGYETPYFIAAPAWWRWLTEPAPVVWTPAPGADAAAMRAIGAERVGEFWISRVASTPNVTIVHNFLSKEDCGFLRGLADAMGLVPANTFGVSNGAEEGGGGGLEKVWRWVTAAFAQCRSPSIKFVRTSKGKFVELAGLARGDLTRLVRILRRAEAVTGLAMGNFEAPFLQLYEPDDVFLAHYGAARFPCLLAPHPVPACARADTHAMPHPLTQPCRLVRDGHDQAVPVPRQYALVHPPRVPCGHASRRRDGVHAGAAGADIGAAARRRGGGLEQLRARAGTPG